MGLPFASVGPPPCSASPPRVLPTRHSLLKPASNPSPPARPLSNAQQQVDKLEAIRGKGVPLDLYEEFRILTLRVIGEAVLGLSHDDSDAVFPKLYLPIMEEGNRNSLEPWRAYIPWIVGRQRERIGKLNDYIIGARKRRKTDGRVVDSAEGGLPRGLLPRPWRAWKLLGPLAALRGAAYAQPLPAVLFGTSSDGDETVVSCSSAILRRRWEDMKAGNGDVRSSPFALLRDTPHLSALHTAQPPARLTGNFLIPAHPIHTRTHAQLPQKYNDIVSKIMKDLEVWTPETEKQLCYEIKTFLLAGHETSAAMLTWSLYELSQNPDMLARVRAEAEAALPVTAALARAQGEAERAKLVAACAERPAVDGMRYTLGVLKEALRRYSVVPCVTRMAAVRSSANLRSAPSTH